MAKYLYCDLIPKKPVGIYKRECNKNTYRFQQVETIPKYCGAIWPPYLPLNNGTYSIVNSIPQTDKHVSCFPDSRYVFEEAQGRFYTNLDIRFCFY